MIVKCPSCAARFRLDQEKVAGKRMTLRCARCRNHFQVELPHPGGQPTKQPGVRVMIAHSDQELCGTIRTILENAGMIANIRHEGEQALRAMVADPPQVAVVDVALQGLYAFEVVDKVRRRPGLGEVKIVLLSSVYNKTAYKRSPSSLYGADDYIEKHHIADDLVPKINRLMASGPSRERPGGDELEQEGEALSGSEAVRHSQGFIASVNQKIQAAEDQEISAAEVPEAERARRLARIIVSDIALYYQDRVDEGIRSGNWSELLADEIKEARNLFVKRFPGTEIQQQKILESAFVDLFEKRRLELNGV